jgi:hypothetical protein
MKSRQTEAPAIAAAKAGFSTATAYRIEADPRLPSKKKKPRGRRRPDLLAGVWESEIVPMLEAAPGIRAVAIFEELCRRHPEIAAGGAPDQDLIFRQEHPPGRMGLSDFTDWTGSGSPLRASHSSTGSITSGCRSRASSMPMSCSAARARGAGQDLHNALWALGGVPEQHRSDSRRPRGHLKRALHDELLLRGSRVRGSRGLPPPHRRGGRAAQRQEPQAHRDHRASCAQASNSPTDERLTMRRRPSWSRRAAASFCGGCSTAFLRV